MKKEYIEPSMEIIKYDIEEKILLNTEIGSGGEPGSEGDGETFVF